MGEICSSSNPLGARPSTFSSFNNLFVPSHVAFAKPLLNDTKTRSCARKLGVSAPIRPPKRHPSGVRIVSKCASNSSSSSSDFVLVSTIECSDGSFVFRFGNKDDETTLVGIDDEEAESAASGDLPNDRNELHFKEKIELDDTLEQGKYHHVGRQSSSSNQVHIEDRGVLEGHHGGVNSAGNLVTESSKSLLEMTALDTKTSGVDEDSAVVDDEDDTENTSSNTGSDDNEGVLNEEMNGDLEENPETISETETMTQLATSEPQAAVEASDIEIVDSSFSKSEMEISDSSFSKSDLDEDEDTAVVDDGDVHGVHNDEDTDKSANTGFQVNDVLNEEIGSDFEENPVVICERETINQFSKSEARVEVLDSYASQAISKENVDIEEAHLTAVGTDDRVNSIEKCESTGARDNSNMVQLTYEAQSMGIEEMTPSTMDGYDDEEETKRSMVLGDNAPVSTCEEQLVGEAPENDVAGLSIPEVVEINSIAGTASRVEASTARFVLSSGVALLSHSSKALTGGENAYFVACQNWLGVADGVGHWSLEGINAGLYSRELMENCERILSNCEGIQMNKPEEVLIRSARKAQSPGSSTVLIAYFDGQALHVANIGDSGFIIIRDGAVIQRSSPMLHEFNFPFQIKRGDNPSELIEVYRIELDEGDVIITATDGLFDNLYEQEITSIVSKALESNLKPEDIADCLADRAQAVGRSSSMRSPFADAAQAAGYVRYTGGKLDDVTVIVSLVQKTSSFQL